MWLASFTWHDVFKVHPCCSMLVLRFSKMWGYSFVWINSDVVPLMNFRVCFGVLFQQITMTSNISFKHFNLNANLIFYNDNKIFRNTLKFWYILVTLSCVPITIQMKQHFLKLPNGVIISFWFKNRNKRFYDLNFSQRIENSDSPYISPVFKVLADLIKLEFSSFSNSIHIT